MVSFLSYVYDITLCSAIHEMNCANFKEEK